MAEKATEQQGRPLRIRKGKGTCVVKDCGNDNKDDKVRCSSGTGTYLGDRWDREDEPYACSPECRMAMYHQVNVRA